MPSVRRSLRPNRCVARGAGLATSILLVTRLLSAQEALRNNVEGEAARETPRFWPASQPYTIKSGDFTVLITPSVSVEWNDNVNTTGGGKAHDVIARPLLQFNANYPITQRNVLNLNVGFGYDYYFDHEELSTWRVQSGSALAFDIFAGDFWINLHERFSYVRDSAREAAVANTSRYGTLNNTAGLSVTWNLNDVTTTLGYDHANVISTSTGFQSQDHTSELLTGRAGFRVHPRATAGVEATGSFTTYDQMTLNDNTGYSVGVYADWQPGSYFQVQPRAGYTAYQFEQTSSSITTGDITSWYAGLTLSHQITDAISYSLNAGREVRLGIQSDAIEDYYVRPNFSWHLADAVTLNSFFSFEHGEQGAGNQAGNLTETYDWFGWGLGLNYAIMKKLSMGLNYRLTLRYSDAAAREYTQNVAGIHLRYLLQ